MSGRKIAFMGLGAMGARMARRLLDAGHEVRVWNRTASRAMDLAALGAMVAETPREAVAECEVAISMVRDDRASNDVWLHPEHGALASLGPSAVAVESSTLSRTWVLELARVCAQRDRSFLDAPVVGSRPHAESGALTYLVGGDSQTFERVADVLNVMGGAIHHVGGTGAGCTAKLVVNALFGTQVAALAELGAMADKAGLPFDRLMEVLGALPVTSAAAKGVGGLIAARRFDPMFPIDLVEKDFSYVEAAAEALGTRCPTSSAVRSVYADAARRGFGDQNIAAVIRAFE